LDGKPSELVELYDRFADEDEGEIKWRKDFLRKIGYKL
jgi:hypothetical protein